MAFGTFDYFHAGHENYLKQAKALGDQLIVVIARDDTVRKVKNKTPMYSERKRLRDVSKSEHVDKAVIGYSEDKYKVIKKYKPNILALGYDQFVFTYGLKQLFIKEGLNTKVVRLHPFEPNTFKSSLIRANATQCEDLSTKNTPA
ncbi:FAD synthase [Candidatus Peregrinibacteria bacterium]|nr:FAD synthase [Candidatus Peregrinibacteria bacterium]